MKIKFNLDRGHLPSDQDGTERPLNEKGQQRSAVEDLVEAKKGLEQNTTAQALTPAEKAGARFLHERNSRMHMSEPVIDAVDKQKRMGEAVSQKPPDKIAAYLKRWERILDPEPLDAKPDFDRGVRNVALLKPGLHEALVIKPENIPQSYWNAQAEMLIRRGEGGDLETNGIRKKEYTDEKGKTHTDYIFPESMQKEQFGTINDDQIASMDIWVDYLASPDSDSFPIWSKYWAFDGMLRLGSFDKAKHEFADRTQTTVAPFPELNKEALAYAVDAVIKKAHKEATPVAAENPEFKTILQGANFGKLYTWAIEKAASAKESDLSQVKGVWIKYNKGSDHMPLVSSLQGKVTGWCTAGETIAKKQLKEGDFYVYYSYDDEGKPVIPSVAIGMKGIKIQEIRGVEKHQSIGPNIVSSDVLNNKLKEFGTEGEKYKKKTQDMEQLTAIHEKFKAKQELTREDLEFLYEFKGKIEGFGNNSDPRVKEILNGRNIKDDISSVTGYLAEQISTTEKEALKGNILYHFGDLDLDHLTSVEGLSLPQSVGGSLNLRLLTSAEGLSLPQSVGGDLNLNGLTSAEGLILPQSIGGHLNLERLTSSEGLILPQSVGGGLYLNSLISAEGLILPQSVGGHLNLERLTSSGGLILPQSVGGDLYLNDLSSAEGLTFPQSIGGDLNLKGLTSAKGLILPQSVVGYLNLELLTSSEGLILPQSVGGNLYLDGLTSVEGLTFPQSVGGDLNINGLSSVEGLTFPQSVGGNLNINGLTSAEGLTLPQFVGGDLHLYNLISAEGLTFPQSVGGDLNLYSLTSAEGLTLPRSIRGYLDLSHLTLAKGLTLPQSVRGDLSLCSLTSAEGLALPQSVGGDLLLYGLTSAEGLALPQFIGGSLDLRRLTSAEGLILPQSVGSRINLYLIPEAEKQALKIKYPNLDIY